MTNFQSFLLGISAGGLIVLLVAANTILNELKDIKERLSKEDEK